MTSSTVADLGLGHLRLSEAYDGVPVNALGAEYGAPSGSLPLREAVAAWQRSATEEVAITTGASLGLVATLATLPRPSSILVPRPGYPAYAQVAAALGLEVVYYELESERRWQPSVESAALGIRDDTRALILNQPNNPTGSVADLGTLQQIEELARRNRLLVISDETYAELVFDGAPVHDMRSIFRRSELVRILSFSKLFGMPGERLGCVIAERRRVQAISRSHWIFAMSPPATAQVIALSTLRSRPDRHISVLKQALARNRERSVDVLSECGEFTFTPPSGGCFVWIEIVGCPLDSRSFARRCLDDGGVNVAPGQVFGVESPVYVRASFAVPDDELTEGLRRLRRVAESLVRRGRSPLLAPHAGRSG